MGEVAISSEELEIELRDEEEETIDNKKRTESRNGMLKWEKLLPRMVMRVLLVEADDSTRQIIAALLRKCNYKVAAVPDGLKAWELLKAKPHKVDLILIEVDLPSISGFALLTLIMEHEICKNIPVIMMSSQDAVSTVYKCMLRGAADYLVKPIRKNELRNLWQHVWRRQSSLAGGHGPVDESVGQDKLEATSENNPATNHSSGDMACIQQNKEFIEKGSDAQSSCAKPDEEAESAKGGNMCDFFQPLGGSIVQNGIKLKKHEASLDYGQKLVACQNQAAAVAACKDSNKTTVHVNIEPESQRMNTSNKHEAGDNNHANVNSSREAIDFMGTSASHNSSSDNSKSKFDISPHLDLSLTRYNPGGFEIQGSEERRTLRISNSSAFTRYSNLSFQPLHSMLEGVAKEANPEREVSCNRSIFNTDNPFPAPSMERSNLSAVNGQAKESEIAISCPQQRVLPIQIPVNGVSFHNLCTGYGSIFSPIFCKQSGSSPTPSPSSGSQPEPNSTISPFHQSNFNSNSKPLYDHFGQTAKDSINLSLQKQDSMFDSDRMFDSVEGRGHISPATDQSATSSFRNGDVSHLNMGYGSTSGCNNNMDQVAIIMATADRKNEEGILHNANSQRAIQREAALNKFRLKRKDRCYEKKVRYESRKKLAEQRPRVKGQFVRQVQPTPSETEQ